MTENSNEKISVYVIRSKSPLHFMESQDRPVEIGKKQFHSIQSLLTAAKLVHHGLGDHVDEIVHNPLRAKAPWNGQAALRQLFNSQFPPIFPHGDLKWQMNIFFAVHSAVLQFALTKGSRIHSEFERLQETYGSQLVFLYAAREIKNDNNKKPFKMTTDIIMTCGISPSQVPEDPEVSMFENCPGNNLYGVAIRLAYHQFITGKFEDGDKPGPLDRRMFVEPVFKTSEIYRESVGILGDSTLKFFTEAHPGGRVLVEGGVTSTKLLKMLFRRGVYLTGFKVIIFSVGTNDSTRSRDEWDGMIENFVSRTQSAMEYAPGLVVIINSGIGYPHWRKLPEYTRQMKKMIEQRLPQDRVTFFDWSVPHGGNPFLHENGDPVVEFAFETKVPKHLNGAGAAKMLREWRKRSVLLHQIHIQTSEEPYQQPFGTLRGLPVIQ